MERGDTPEKRRIKRDGHAMRGKLGRDIAFHLLQCVSRVARRQVEEGSADSAE